MASSVVAEFSSLRTQQKEQTQRDLCSWYEYGRMYVWIRIQKQRNFEGTGQHFREAESREVGEGRGEEGCTVRQPMYSKEYA
jgi:hypothetical protein